jgi:peptide deformylase
MKIIEYPNPILSQKAEKIKGPSALEIKELILAMTKTMRKANGLGLAAPQIGKSLQLCLVQINADETSSPLVLINPKITAHSSDATAASEGCLSFPGKFLPIIRFEKVQVRYFDEKGKRCKIKASGLLARALQHEIDHLNGILIIDRK